MNLNLEDRCLVSQEIRERIQKKDIMCTFDEHKIQPSSFEPSIGEEVFVLDTETQGIFRPRAAETIYRTLLKLPSRQRQRKDISQGYELKVGHTYFFPLQERFILHAGESIRSSPKSSMGRLFVNTRMLTDYNPCFDEIDAFHNTETALQAWLLVQPLAFNLLVLPGLTFNQLRFFTGQNAKLTPQEIGDVVQKHPMLYNRDNDKLTPLKHKIASDGFEITLNLSGKKSEGIIGLRARHNAAYIDLTLKHHYEAEDYFEPIIGDGTLRLAPREYYLLSNREVLQIPENYNVVLQSHSHISIAGPLHFAGFIDNGFSGDLVLEVRSDEQTPMALIDGMPIGRLDVFRTRTPDKLYGEKSGAHYQGQTEIRLAKNFRPFDHTFTARHYAKLERMVLVQDKKVLQAFRHQREGFEEIDEDTTRRLCAEMKNGFFHSRYDCEGDELVLQPIPYVLLFGPDQTIFRYMRASNRQAYGEQRLFGRLSIGVGGHIKQSDGPDFLGSCIQRELAEEVSIPHMTTEPRLVGTLMQHDTPVDRVHFGLIYSSRVAGNVRARESALLSGSMIAIDELEQDKDKDKYETWTRALIPHLHKIYKRTPYSSL